MRAERAICRRRGGSTLSARERATPPGSAEPHPLARALLFIAADAPLGELALPGTLQTRRFVASAGTPRHIALVEFAWEGTRSQPEPQAGWQMQLYRAYGA